MLRCFFFIFLGIIFSNDIFSQINICECNRFYFKAEKAYYADNPDSVVIYFEKAFAIPNFGNVSTHFNAADKLIRIGNIELARELLLASTSKGASLSEIYDFKNRYPEIDLSIDSSKIAYTIPDTLSLDEVLINDLKFIYQRDQLIRNEFEDLYNDEYKKLIDYGNFLIVKNILDRYQGTFPDLKIIGYEGERYLKTILLHFDIEWLAELFPALLDAIHKGYSINQDLIYQIDRNIVDSGQVYFFDEKSGGIILGKETSPIANSNFYHQYYGGYEIYISEDKGLIWWPFHNHKELKNVNLLRTKLCLDSLEDYLLRRPYIKFVSEDEFLNMINY